MPQTLSSLRHSVRGCMNVIKLCVSALQLQCSEEEQIEFLDDVISSAQKTCDLLAEMEQIETGQLSENSPQRT